MEKSSGVYKITCVPTAKVYVGSSINIRKRRNQHLSLLRNHKHPNEYLQRAFIKYGEKAFTFEVLLHCGPELLLLKEEEQIKKFDSFQSGFNLLEIPTGGVLGLKHTDAAKAKMSAIRKAAGRSRNNGSLQPSQVPEIRLKFFNGARVSELAEEYQIHRKTIRQCVRLETYIDIPCDIIGYEEMLEELAEARKQGKRLRSRGWNHSEEFKKRFSVAVSKPKLYARRLSDSQVLEIRSRKSGGETCRTLADEFGVNQNTISRICRFLIYKEVG